MALKNLGDIFNQAVINIAGDRLRDYTKILLVWKDVVGCKVADNASPARFDNGVLKVAVKNSIWMQEMILYKYKFISAYKKRNLNIKDIIFFLDVSQNKWGT